MRWFSFIFLFVVCASCTSWGRFWEINKPVYTWYSYWGGSLNEAPVSVKETSDGGYAFLATASGAITNMAGKSPIIPFTGGSADWLVAKVDAKGNLEWYTFIGGGSSDYPGELVATSDGGVVAAGYGGAALSIGTAPSLGTFAGSGAMFVVKLNSDGSVGWYDTISGTGDTQARGIATTSDGGYIVSGLTTSSVSLCSTANGSYQSSGYDLLAVKLTGTGAVQWCTYLGAGSAVNEYGKHARQATDGGYFIGGDASATSGSPIIAFQGGGQDLLIYKLNASGVMLWQTFLGSSASDSMNRLYPTQDGGVAIAGSFGNTVATLGSFTYTGSYGGGTDAVLAKLNASGQLQWFKLYGGSGNDSAFDIFESSDGSLTACFTAATNLASLYGISPRRPYTLGDDITIMRTDSVGSPLWYTFYGSSTGDAASTVSATSDGGFIFTGTAGAAIADMGTSVPVNSYANGNDAFLLKLNADGNL